VERRASRAVGAGADAAPALRFEGVSFGYPGATGLALSGVRLAAFAGEIVAVVGGNGSGKSTLARLANGLLQPAEGRVVVAGTSAELCTSNPRDIWPVRAAVGLLFQDPDDQIVGATG
jgi:energy-coupling factor transporter ATP-binding protein EcfA2